MSYLGLFAQSAVPLSVLVLSHSWGAATAEIKAAVFAILSPRPQVLASAEREPKRQQAWKRHLLVASSANGRDRDAPEKLMLLAGELTAERPAPRTGASQLMNAKSKESSESRQPKQVKTATLAPATPPASKAPVPKSKSPVDATMAEEQETSPRKSPSILQLVEGREQDLIIAGAIAVAFFSVGWICGGIYYLRRDRIRRTKLRF